MKKVELLAPAKNIETAIAAINSGADAIYIGAVDYGARKNAPNSLSDIEKLVNYAHLFNVKIHVVINTILNNEELKDAINLIHKLYEIGVDAIIVQDMGLLNAAIESKLPPIEIHASTQCNNRTLDKAKFFDNVGVSRVILARELSLDAISEICNNVKCEVETFVHGALCVSYSGQCYFSYANGGRSANRGECAQPCRKKYSLVDESGKVLLKDKYLLSLKDFNASNHLKSLVEAGVKSFKIEGRLKDINYVKNVVAYYSNELNKYAARTSSGKVFLDFTPNADKTFNRGYTNYFLKEREQCFNFLSPKSRGEKIGKIKRIFHNYFEIDAELAPQDGLCFIKDGDMTGFLVNKVEGNKVYPNKMDGLKSGTLLYRNFDAKFEKLLETSKTVRKLPISIQIFDGKIVAIDEDNNKAEVLLPLGEQPNNLEKLKSNIISQLSKTGETVFYVNEIEILDDNLSFLPVSKINELRRELLQMLSNERLRNYKRNSQKPIGYAQFPESKIDYRGNVFNDNAKSFYKNCNCDVKEFALETQSNIPQGIELMRTKHCLKFAAGICGQPCKKLYLVDVKGKKYPLKFDCKNCEMVVLSP
ncbi:U32 family peptidase [bacterium]|nr:U32 family peptidase [bacterium]